MDKNCDNCINSGRPSYELPCTACTTAFGSAPSKWESIVAKDANVHSWIPVSERLPEEEELVLIICKNGKRSVGCYRRFNYNNEIMWGFKTELNPSIWLNKGRVTHWMPLPEPPKEECHEKENCLPRM